MASGTTWAVGQLVNVQPRTWAGINRPGGVGRITELHYSNGFIESLDVKYLVGGGNDTKLDLDFVEAYEPLDTKGRSRRGRGLYSASPAKRDVSQPHSDRPAKKAKKNEKSASTKQSNEKSKEVPKTKDENTDPKKNVKPVHRQVKSTKSATKTPKERKKPPATHVIIKHNCEVSPLADTPAELRHQKKKSTKSSIKKGQNKGRPLPLSAKTGKADQGFVIQKASRPEDDSSQRKVAPVSLAAKCQAMAPPKKNLKEKKPLSKTKVQMNRVPLKQVYDSEMARANTFVEGVVGKPKATSLPDEKNPPGECTVTLSPPNTERIELFVSKMSELFAYDDDGVDKAELLEKVNKKLSADSCAHFDLQEMENCLSILSSEGKIMVSDGVVYSF